MTESALTHLSCTACVTSSIPPTACRIVLHALLQAARRAQYDLGKAARTLTKESLVGRERSLWRYAEVLPVLSQENRITLGEGGTPLPGQIGWLRKGRTGTRFSSRTRA